MALDRPSVHPLTASSCVTFDKLLNLSEPFPLTLLAYCLCSESGNYHMLRDMIVMATPHILLLLQSRRQKTDLNHCKIDLNRKRKSYLLACPN